MFIRLQHLTEIFCPVGYKKNPGTKDSGISVITLNLHHHKLRGIKATKVAISVPQAN